MRSARARSTARERFLIAGIGLDAAKLEHGALPQRRQHFSECSGYARAAAAVEHQHAGILRYQACQLGELFWPKTMRVGL